jgi:LmbE family N-acetylglucosaminyl deacetylase
MTATMSPLDQQLARLLAEPGASVVVGAPHPDDETLASGGLLQRAQAAGAAVSVLLLTDGDNNPWPQRWLERRLRIDADARAAWGRRRRAEAIDALACLGLPASCLHAMGWPDLGLTARIADQLAASLVALRAALLPLHPTLIVAPILEDRHPDHSAARVLTELVLAHWPAPRPALWGFAVHGSATQAQAFMLSADERARKGRALEAHVSQLALAGGRWRRRVAHGESYVPAAAPVGTGMRLELPWLPAMPQFGACALLVACGEQAWQLPWREGAVSGPLRLQLHPQPALGFAQTPRAPVFVKLYSRRPGLWIFDHWGWRQGGQEPALTLPSDSASLA